MLLRVNEKEIDIPEGSNIRNAINISKAPYLEGCVLGVVKGKEEVERHVNKFSIKTTKGSIIIELIPESSPNLVKTWKDRYKEFENLRVRWTSSNEVSIGPIKTELEPTRDVYPYERWDVIMSLSGFTADATHVILSKTKHEAIYGAPEDNKGVFAKVIGGKKTIIELTDRDFIEKVEPVLERRSIIKSAAITDPDTKIMEGNEIFTYILVKPTFKSPRAAEHFFALSEEQKLKIDYESNSFLGFYNLQGLEIEQEYVDQRRRGTVTLRNTGKGIGRVYIYREDRVSTPSHSIIGYVDRGMQLLDIARYGDYVTFKTDPDRIITLSMTQKEADDYLTEKGIKQIREGLDDDKAVIVKQEPRYTMDIINKKQAKTYGIREDEIIYVDINDVAPRSSWYFKKITGLLDSPVGSLKVHFAFPGMKVMMFKGSQKDSKLLIPENTPKKCVKAGEIGVTNISRKYLGMIGVRFENNDEFGPTGEPFDGTNIIGKIVKGLENLEKFKEGDIVYVSRKSKS
ncbi:MAG: methanogenesis marker 3 protein [Euryarchaeota archaeon]|nr:methanogenesis marker 3 protein [Euryarchaeota archaeon]